MGEFVDFALVPEQGVTPEMAQLDPQMQQRIRALAAKLNVQSDAAVLGFGARAQKEMNAFADIALTQMLRKDMGDLSGTMEKLAAQIRSCSFAAEAKGVLKRMLGKASGLAQVREAYEKAEPVISACADDMTDRRVALMRDSALLSRLYERNEALYRELCSLIVVGDEALRQARERGEEAHVIARLERRMQDIRVTQLASTQLAAQIRMVQASDSVTCEKLKTALESTIPLWKSQMAAALGLARATDTLAMHRKAAAQAARGIRQGAKELKAQRGALVQETARSDRERAEQTAQELIRELESIEAGLREKEMKMKA